MTNALRDFDKRLLEHFCMKLRKTFGYWSIKLHPCDVTTADKFDAINRITGMAEQCMVQWRKENIWY